MELSAHFQMQINIYTYFFTKWRPLQRTQSYLLILTIINGGVCRQRRAAVTLTANCCVNNIKFASY